MNASAICFLQDLNLSSRMPRRKRVLSPLGGAERTKVREGVRGIWCRSACKGTPHPGSLRSPTLSRKGRGFLERLRGQSHGARSSGLDAGELRAGFRQHALHEETPGHELDIEPPRGAVGTGRELAMRGRRHACPHVAEHDEPE